MQNNDNDSGIYGSHTYTCPSGKPHYTKRDAQTKLNARTGSSRRKRRRSTAKFLRIYECPQCGYWHLTHKGDK